MKLTFVVHQFLPRYFTGTEQYVYAVAKAMQARGHDVEVFALEPNFAELQPSMLQERELVDGIPVVRLRFWYCTDRDFERMEYANPLVSAKFAHYLRQRRPDAVHFFHVRYLGASLVGEAKAQSLTAVVHLMDFWFLCPAVVLRRGDGSLCDGPPEGGLGCVDCVRPDLGQALDQRSIRDEVRALAPMLPPGLAPRQSHAHRAFTLTGRLPLLREHLLRADRIVAPSRFLRSMFVNNGYPESRIEVLSYGIDESRLAHCATERTMRPFDAPLRCAYFGTIAEYKGTDVAVDAVLGSQAAIDLKVYGRTSDFAEFAGPLVERARNDARIAFPGPFAREHLGQVLAETDVLLVPSRWYENTPFVVHEAFAGGVPVVASDLGGLRELVRGGVCGDLFIPGSALDLRLRLERLVREPERLARYRSALPRQKGMAENAAEIEDLYRSIPGGVAPPVTTTRA